MKHGVDISLVKSLGSKSPGLKRPLTFYQYDISMEAKGGKERLNIANVMNDFQIILISTFDPIKIQTRSAPQNDRLNFSFVKDTYIDGEKLARNKGQILSERA